MKGSEAKTNRKGIHDLLLVCVLLLAAAGLFAWRHRPGAGGTEAYAAGRQVVIKVDGREVWKGELKPEDGELRISGANGGSNVFEMERDAEGRLGLHCVEADCPDLICVHTGTVTLPDEPIVCLPHKVTARILE